MKPVSKATRPTDIKVSRVRRFMAPLGRNQQDLARSFPSFQVAMGLCSLCKMVSFIDADLERPRLDPPEHIARPRKQLFSRRGVLRQARPRQKQRALGRQQSRLERLHRAARLAE